MKRIIDGKTYNTDTSTMIGRQESETETERYKGILYVTRGGAFFVHHTTVTYYHDQDKGEWCERQTDQFEPLSRGDAHAWVMNGETEIHADVFSEPPEAHEESESEATIYIRVPELLKRRIEERAAKAGQSINAWATRCMESCLWDHTMKDLAFRKSLLVESVEHAAEWRAEKAKEHPDDTRNADCSRSLNALAERLKELPPDHPKLREILGLEKVADDEGQELTCGEAASSLISRYGFDSPKDGDPEPFLAEIVAAFQHELSL